MMRKLLRWINGIYQLFYELFGERVVNLVYDNLRGSTIYFPSKLHSKDYARKKIAENMDRLNVRELAKLTGYSERSVRWMISEITEDDQWGFSISARAFFVQWKKLFFLH